MARESGDPPAASAARARRRDLHRDGGRPPSRLTDREREVLGLAARGRSNRQIGEALAITEGTVKSHLHRIFRKMRVANRTEAAVAFLEPGRAAH